MAFSIKQILICIYQKGNVLRATPREMVGRRWGVGGDTFPDFHQLYRLTLSYPK